jgi:hypothetical protein
MPPVSGLMLMTPASENAATTANTAMTAQQA